MKRFVRIYFQSDWTITTSLPNGYDGQDFVIRLFTSDRLTYFEAKNLRGVLTNCTIDAANNQVVIYVNNSKLAPGCVKILQAYDYANNHFVDGVENLMTCEETNIYLVTQDPNSTSAMFTGSALPDLTGAADYVTEADLDAALEDYVTASYLESKGYATEDELADYVTEEDLDLTLGDFVTKDELSAAGYMTSIPSEYITQAELSANTYTTEAYVREYVTSHTGSIDLSAYVTKSELSAAGYVTSEDLNNADYVTNTELSECGYATTTYVEQYVSTHSGSVDLSAYVTKEDLNAAGYATTTYVEEYVTSHTGSIDLSAYVTKNELSAAGYVTGQELSNAGYITLNDIPVIDTSSYVTKTELSNAGYITSIPSEYITESELAACGYATTTYVEQYVSEHSGSIDLSAYVTKSELQQAAYVTKTELDNAGYLTSIPSEYITESELAACGYITLNDIPVIDTSSYVTKSELSNAGYITSIPSEYITESELAACGYATTTYVEQYVSTHSGSVDMSSYVTKAELDNAGYLTPTDLQSMGYMRSYTLTQAQYDNLLTVDPDTLYIISDGYIGDMTTVATKSYVADYVSTQLHDYVSYSQFNAYISGMGYLTAANISGMGYLTAANFIYDSTTYTLTISI